MDALTILAVTVVALTLDVLIANYAKQRGLDWGLYFALSLFLSPIVGLLLVVVAPVKIAGDVRKCPDCAETIKAEANVCRFCGKRFDVPPTSPAAGHLAASEASPSTASADVPEVHHGTSDGGKDNFGVVLIAGIALIIILIAILSQFAG